MSWPPPHKRVVGKQPSLFDQPEAEYFRESAKEVLERLRTEVRPVCSQVGPRYYELPPGLYTLLIQFLEHEAKK
jgi:hypothetical protein